MIGKFWLYLKRFRTKATNLEVKLAQGIGKVLLFSSHSILQTFTHLNCEVMILKNTRCEIHSLFWCI